MRVLFIYGDSGLEVLTTGDLGNRWFEWLRGSPLEPGRGNGQKLLRRLSTHLDLTRLCVQPGIAPGEATQVLVSAENPMESIVKRVRAAIAAITGQRVDEQLHLLPSKAEDAKARRDAITWLTGAPSVES